MNFDLAALLAAAAVALLYLCVSLVGSRNKRKAEENRRLEMKRSIQDQIKRGDYL